MAQTPAERQAAYRARRKRGEPTTAPELRPCGTYAAYVRHRRKGETPCDACVAALREYHRRRRQSGG